MLNKGMTLISLCMKLKWKLNESNFTWLDRLKLCKFFLNKNNFWTMSNYVAEYETAMKQYVGVKHAVYVSSGSAANTLLAMYLKDNCKNKGIVVLPSTTWITSVAPFIREGFKPVFIDIELHDLSMSLIDLEEYLKYNNRDVAAVFVTSLLGFSPNIVKLKEIELKYEVRVMLDNCESTFSTYNNKNISSYFTSTTSTYFGHLTQSVEGGFIFTNNDEEYEYFLMARNHGMTRSLVNSKKYENPDVDSRFDFNILGNNLRNTNINAYIGLLDFKRINQYSNKRVGLYKEFYKRVNNSNLMLWNIGQIQNYIDVPFSIPILFVSTELRDTFQRYCNENGIENRPIVSGNILRQTCLKQYFTQHFNNSDTLHYNGLYIGLHSKVKLKDIEQVTAFLNSLK